MSAWTISEPAWTFARVEGPTWVHYFRLENIARITGNESGGCRVQFFDGDDQFLNISADEAMGQIRKSVYRGGAT